MDKPDDGGRAAMLAEVPLLENLNTPEVFATWVTGFGVEAGNVTLCLEAMRFSHAEKRSARVVIGRIVMPISAAQSLAIGLYDFLKQRGFDPAPIPPDQPVQ